MLSEMRKARPVCWANLVFFALATIYIYNYETKTEVPCEDTIENCVGKVMEKLNQEESVKNGQRAETPLPQV